MLTSRMSDLDVMTVAELGEEAEVLGVRPSVLFHAVSRPIE